jgi:hypothetical protein
MAAVGRPREEAAIRRTGWRPPLLPGPYQDLVFTIIGRPEFEGQPTRAVVEAALRAYATAEELAQVDLPEKTP